MTVSSPALAQTAPASSSTSATLQPTKGLGYGQIAQNGDKFDEFLRKYGDGAIDEAEKMLDGGKWTEKDFDNFVKYQDAKDVKAVVSLDIANDGKRKAAIEQKAQISQEWQKLANMPDSVLITLLQKDKDLNP